MFKNILAPIDGSDTSLKALEMAARIAEQNNAKLHIISAAEPLPPLATQAGGGAPAYMGNYQQDLHESLKETQETQVTKLREKHPDLEITAKVIDGRAATVIKEQSKDKDLIVMGHRGRGGVLSWVLGSVAKTVVDTSRIPVLIIKDEEMAPE
jgi:nucleotide-binding universal stress UspA family protein